MQKVTFSELQAYGDSNIGLITLSRPLALNSLDLDMINCLLDTLLEWRERSDISAIFIDSQDHSVFCAGGDVVRLHKELLANRQTTNNHDATTLPQYVKHFFSQEYRMNYCIHTYPKPIVCWGNGLIMGGGAGIFSASSIKIVTHASRFSMPEISIGLFPDVGASYFLNRLPDGVGHFLGFTGAQINAEDCLNFGLADYFLNHECKQVFVKALTQLRIVDIDSIRQLCINMMVHNASIRDDGWLTRFTPQLSELRRIKNVQSVDFFLQQLSQKYSDNQYLKNALITFRNGSPISAHLVMEQLSLGRTKSLSECLVMELCMAYQCCLSNDFLEGVRALLVDKDKKPNWQNSRNFVLSGDALRQYFHFNNELMAPLLTLENDFGLHQPIDY